MRVRRLSQLPYPYKIRIVKTQVCLLACILFLPVPASRAQNVSIVTPVGMESDPDHKMVVVRCQVNGFPDPHACVIDSGATNTIISDRVVKAEGPIVEMSTGNGVVRVHQREVSLTIADRLEIKCKAFIQSRMPQGVDILIGQDVLRQFRFVILDYKNRLVEFQR
jgi:gag-polyprotein putative aspartyl protease